MPPTKEQQDSESRAREQTGIDPALNAEATNVIDDGAPGDPGADAAPAPRPPVTDQRQPPAPPPFISKRDEIIARFRNDRNTRQEEDQDDLGELAEGANLPLELRAPAPAPAETLEPDTPAEPSPAAPPAKHKVKVHGEERELTYEELVAQAQIALASDNVLDKAKLRLEEADRLLKQVKENAARGGLPGDHTGATAQSLQPQNPVNPDEQGAPDQDPEFAKLIETLQFGDPAEASTLFETTIDKRVNARVNSAVEQALQGQRLKDEGARTAKVLSDFEQKHADIAKDPFANAAIQTRMFQLQVDDLKALGVDPAQLPTLSGTVTPADIAMAHRWYRAQGYNVRKPEDLLDQAVTDFVAWKGPKASAEQPSPAATPAGKAPPRVEVAVDRDARRAAIPQQPDRAAAPRPAPSQAAPQPRDRSAIVQNMIASRSAPRGKVGIA